MRFETISRKCWKQYSKKNHYENQSAKADFYMGKHTYVGLTRCGVSNSTSQKGVCFYKAISLAGNVMSALLLLTTLK